MDEVEEVVGGVKKVFEEVADALGTPQAAQPGKQGIPPILATLADHLHLKRM